MKTFAQLVETITIRSGGDGPDKVLKDFHDTTTQHPMNHKVRMTPEGVGIEASKFGNSVHISSLVSHNEKGKGHASKALKMLTGLADKHGVDMDLVSQPLDHDRTGLNQDQLNSWYGRHGFQPHGDVVSGWPQRMVRKPTTTIKLRGFKRQH